MTQLLETLDEITDAIKKGYDVNIIYRDFCKAFDKIPHQRLMKKIGLMVLEEKSLNGLKNF